MQQLLPQADTSVVPALQQSSSLPCRQQLLLLLTHLCCSAAAAAAAAPLRPVCGPYPFVPQTTKSLLLLLSPAVDRLAMQQGRVDGAPQVLQLTSQLAATGWEIGAQRVPRLLLPARV